MSERIESVVVAIGYRIDFLYTVHGIDPMALAQTEAMKQAYNTLRARNAYLRVCPESELLDEQGATDEVPK